MRLHTPPRNDSSVAQKSRPRRRLFRRFVEDNAIRELSFDEYRDKVRSVYGGPKGALLAAASWISLHEPLGDRLMRTRKFDLRGMRSILDVGSGAGQIARHLIKYSDPGTEITCCDLS